MTTHPILFNGPMVRAVLEGRKTQTRRVVKPQPTLHNDGSSFFYGLYDAERHKPAIIERCPYGVPGHTLWVRENFRVGACDSLFFQADEEWHEKAKWRPSLHMPRWASRIDLLVKRVWVEQVQDISEADAIAEGSYLGRCECLPRAKDRTPVDVLFQQTECHIHGLEFKALWNSIYGKKPGCSWADNPWVWAVEFELKEVRG